MTIHLSRRDFVKHASLLTAASALGVRHAFAADAFVVADTAFGKIRGVEVEGIKIFKGVPYGANTTGQNRFMPPRRSAEVDRRARRARVRPERAADGTRRAAQRVGSSPLPARGCRRKAKTAWCSTSGRRRSSDGRKRPVMVWCHGGGFTSGSGSSPITTAPTWRAAATSVVVTINHRLNVLGFTYLAEPGGADFAASGDVGHARHRPRAANGCATTSTHFGGDPGTVTMFGQSGGGRKVGTLLAMPRPKACFIAPSSRAARR